MKKILTIIITILTLSTTVFAGDESVEKRVTDAFKKEFAAAQNARWQVTNKIYKVTFSLYDRTISAYFDRKGSLLGVTKNMLSTDLPYYLQRELKEYYQSYWVTNLFELSNYQGTAYYVTLQSSEGKLILSSRGSNSWEYDEELNNY